MASPMESNQNWHNHSDGDQSLLHCFCEPKVKSLSNLYAIDIKRCDSLRNLFLLGTAEDGLRQLQWLKIKNCQVMEEVFLNKENEKDERKSQITFPELYLLRLNNVPSLQTFYRGEIESIEFPVLETLKIKNCPKLTSMASPVESNQNWHNHNDDDQSLLHCFCDPKVKFGGLKSLQMGGYNDIGKLWCQQIPLHFFRTMKTLEILDCYGIKSLFSSLAYENFVNLEELIIRNCNQIEKVIAYMKEIDEKSVLFPKLDELCLEYLPLLGMFCEWRCVVELSSLRHVIIKACPQMQFLTPGSLSTPNVEDICIDNEELKKREMNEMGGLNGVVRQHMSTRMTIFK